MYDKKINEEVRNKTKVVLDELKKNEQSKTKENLKDL
jgi:hypothetical protein